MLHDENNKWISAAEYQTGAYQVSDSLYANFIKNSLPYYLMSLRKGKQTGDYSEADKILAAFPPKPEKPRERSITSRPES